MNARISLRSSLIGRSSIRNNVWTRVLSLGKSAILTGYMAQFNHGPLSRCN